MISKLPSFIWMNIWFLAFIAGIVNVVGFMGFGHEAITHLTGNTTKLAEAIGTLNVQLALHVTALMGAFVIGTAISGFIIHGEVLELKGGYGMVLALESILLFISIPLLRSFSGYGVYAAACACGLQNAMVSTYSGAIVRTTHVSGMFTDLGIAIGHIMRGAPINRTRVSLCLIVISGFLFGGIFGARVFTLLDYGTLFFPAAFTAILSFSYWLYRKRTRRLK